MDAGNIRVDERVQFEPNDMVPGSGGMKDLNLGTMISKDLATWMVIISDNTKTERNQDTMEVRII
ncbi:serine hydrolase [Evansella sp. AB-rgal1]|uniref:serine hydrolase n=1 Tax=Evansella sp. AB-rgal1 TaxID=3242696 RepID=UPI00359D64C1